MKRATPMPRAKRELRARVAKTVRKQRRDTGPTPAQRALVAERAAYACELCGRALVEADGGWVVTHSFHHRQARGMGGSSRPDVNSPANILLLCGTGTTGCHGFVEAHRTSAEAEGWLVRHGQDPAAVEVTVLAVIDGMFAPGTTYTRRVRLNDAGDYLEAS